MFHSHFRQIALFLLLLLPFSSCKQTAPLNGKLKSDNLPSQLVTISTIRDNNIRLSGGTIIQIPANALKNANGDSVKLEIKEALTIEQMIAAGLYTRSNGELLASGGMLYIAPQEGQDVKILKSMKVVVPADQTQEGMQLFRGEVVDAAINWVDPKPLEVSKMDARLAHGKKLLTSNCYQCHDVTKKIVGPPLFGAIQRWENDTNAVYEYTRDIAPAMHKYPRATCVYNEYRISMPAFPTLTKEEMDDMYLYIQEEGMKRLGGMPAEYTNTSCDSCFYIYQLEYSLYSAGKGRFAINYYGRPTDTIKNNLANGTNVINVATDTTSPVISNVVIPPPPTYYSFDISTFGWFNIDQFLADNIQTEITTLKVIQEGLASSTLYPVLVVPSLKIIQAGAASSDNHYFYFKEEDGKVQLPPNKKAYILVMGEKSDTVLFGITNFVTGGDQTIKVNIQKSNKVAVKAAIGRLKLPDAKINVEKTNNVNTDQLKLELDRLRKKYPGCNLSDSSK
ncbi:MAG: cytochrome [Bacteroidetes bacterium]|nr:cytochrome [Bacteroidota bacterium]